MLSKYNAIDIEIVLRTSNAPPPFPPIDDRAAWDQVRGMLGERRVAQLIADAEEGAASEIPSLPATLFLEFDRTGQRGGYETPQSRRRYMLCNLTLAECLENQDRFLDPILDLAWAICEESSWVYPAHQRTLTDIREPAIDLGVAMTALELAEMDALVGRKLDPLLGKRIRDEMDRRCFTPYLARHDFWWLHKSQLRNVNNWTAVCNAGVAGAAIYLEQDQSRLAEILARAARSLDDYLETFDVDGGSTEGPGYWDYGFGYYTVLAHLVEQHTEGRIEFLGGELMRKIAAYPLRTLLSSGQYVNFSDCDTNISYSRAHLAFLGARMALPDLAAFSKEQPEGHRPSNLTWGVRELFWQPPADRPEKYTPASHDWFGGMMWMVSRYDPSDPNGLVLAAKGGHNDEMHNQNDVGNIIVHVNGESIIADIGRGRYTKAYFGPERYDHLVNSSLGHSVPAANDHVQAPGEEHVARLIEHSSDENQDTLLLEMAGAYPAEAGLSSLRRRITFHREPPSGWVELIDEAVFADAPGKLESALTTFGEADIGYDAVVLQGLKGKLRVGFDPDLIDVRVDHYQDVDLSTGPRDVHRVVFALDEPATEGVIRLEIVPV